ncbi:hypothetical protein B296_00035302 [Ensete ventricosum]|uniref:Uncharacterized protein n=1 Tax=Ensete ventricosum TaxID=4639 RepID=A0A426ZE53_ENSVE|nr:hypothetical protein B296_00035302 [Ensete ventricosum]
MCQMTILPSHRCLVIGGGGGDHVGSTKGRYLMGSSAVAPNDYFALLRFTRASNDYFALLLYCLVIGSGRGHHVGSTKRRDPIGCRPLVAVTGKHFYCTDEMTCTLEDSQQTMQSTFTDMVI